MDRVNDLTQAESAKSPCAIEKKAAATKAMWFRDGAQAVS